MSVHLPLLIEPMQLEDLPAVLDIERASHVDPWKESFFAEELTRPYAMNLVARLRDDRRWIVGYICMWLVADEVQIFNLAVDPAVRRQGVGRRLLLAALQKACTQNARMAFLEVRRSNLAAQKLYETIGFRPSGLRPDYYDGVKEPAVLMELEMDRRWRSRWLLSEAGWMDGERSC